MDGRCGKHGRNDRGKKLRYWKLERQVQSKKMEHKWSEMKHTRNMAPVTCQWRRDVDKYRIEWGGVHFIFQSSGTFLPCVFMWLGGWGEGLCDVWRRDLKLYLYAFHLLKGDVILKIYFVRLLSHFDTGYCKVLLLQHLPCTILLRTTVQSVIWPSAIWLMATPFKVSTQQTGMCKWNAAFYCQQIVLFVTLFKTEIHDT